jgi:hypothetical protein
MMAGAAMVASAGSALAVDPWADSVVSYTAGTGADSNYLNASTALGSPERVSGENTPFGSFPGSVTPFAGAYGIDEIVSIGAGGSLVVRFDEPVTDDPMNPYGLDLIVFGNSFFTTNDFVNPRVSGIAADGGQIAVSADGTNWFSVSGAADGLFPTLGYLDETQPFGGPAGSVPSDFTKPVNPAFDPTNLSLAQLIAGYDGSGGGFGVDIASTGLSQINFVRIELPMGGMGNVEIDAFSDVSPVPGPGGLAVMLGMGGMLCVRRRK